jgi:hypothetical protein
MPCVRSPVHEAAGILGPVFWVLTWKADWPIVHQAEEQQSCALVVEVLAMESE